MARSYFRIEDYKTAILWFQKELPLIKADFEHWLQKKNMMAITYFFLENYNTAIRIYKEIIKDLCKYIGVTIGDVRNNRVKNEDLGIYLYCYSNSLYGIGHKQDGDNVRYLAAKCGHKLAIDYCKENNIRHIGNNNRLFD